METKYANLICPGTMRSGTTTLFNILKQHPALFAPEKKELHFFDREFEKGMEYYEEYFKDAGDRQYRMDFSPYYMFSEISMKRIKDTLGTDVRFVVILRNPVDRAYSMYNTRINQMREKLSFEKALAQEDERISANEYGMRQYSYRSRGFYGEQAGLMLKLFPRENIHFMLFEEFTEDPEREVRKLLDFLKLEPHVSIRYDVWKNKPWQYSYKLPVRIFKWIRNSRLEVMYRKLRKKIPEKAAKSMAGKIGKRKAVSKPTDKNPNTCRMLMEDYIRDICKLEGYIGRDLSFWIRKYIPEYEKGSEYE